jgi:hypothetical protein
VVDVARWERTQSTPRWLTNLSLVGWYRSYGVGNLLLFLTAAAASEVDQPLLLDANPNVYFDGPWRDVLDPVVPCDGLVEFEPVEFAFIVSNTDMP